MTEAKQANVYEFSHALLIRGMREVDVVEVELVRCIGREIDAELRHRFDHDRVDVLRWAASRRPCLVAAVGCLLEEGLRHLGASSVLNADE